MSEITAAREPEILRENSRLRVRSERVQKLSLELEGRFGMVLRPMIEPPAPAGAPPRPGSPLARALAESNDTLEMAIRRFEQMIDRCELPSHPPVAAPPERD